MKSTKPHMIVETISLLFIILFVYASISKLVEYDKFKVQLGQSPMITSFAELVAWGIPTIEIIIAILLAIPMLRMIGLISSFLLMVMFTSYIVAITQFADYVPCSCGGVLQNMGWEEHLLFNIGFTLLSVIAVLFYSKDEEPKEKKNIFKKEPMLQP